MSKPYRTEYPRPQFRRDHWVNLNGEWEFAFDDNRVGIEERWYDQHPLPRTIQVPFCFQSELSAIGDIGFHDTVWYRKMFTPPAEFSGKRIFIHFGAVDYAASVWVNGRHVVDHEGGHTPFQADITDVLKEENNEIVVRAEDFSRDVTLPRGKQYWQEKSAQIFYTRTTGIWQTVWVEAVAEAHLAKVRMTPDIDSNSVRIEHYMTGTGPDKELELQVKITFKGEPVAEDRFSVQGPQEVRTISVHDFNDHSMGRWWSPEHPNLYDVEFTLLQSGKAVDQVQSYFGMRKISIVGGKLCLNNRPYFMKLVLDQGYFPDGVLTAPSDEAFVQDIQMTKAMGFNGARKHQKVEDPRYLYWADRLGLLVWGEMANAYQYSFEYVGKITKEWMEVVSRDYNHPSVVAWVPLNESWGVPNILIEEKQRQHSLALYHMTKSLDQSRPVISNDGWEHTKSDILTIHDYEWRREILEDRYSTVEKAVGSMPANRWLTLEGYPYENQPIHVSEFGGISFKKSDWEGWGYSGADNEQDFLNRLVAVIHPMLQSPVVQGFCYTQLTDVEQEINGLLTYDRKPKLPFEVIKAINEGKVPVLKEEQASGVQQNEQLKQLAAAREVQ
ncbi:glycoside hydrolase family 2 [Paenibacillus hexagrammi]|uniref:Glycoside hydrolase family 2 n=2 Tax=Paenibacillus hexagrammi TaxID=2908839 RepID=A0ABY3STE7_9BACL|nr:sugar-binding domain-containing protein [Paenibacillus sp. YPD9-1]UJF36286.1 glycoside hydrolase family 2 [Paenibacillus sp. YPD9-1]